MDKLFIEKNSGFFFLLPHRRTQTIAKGKRRLEEGNKLTKMITPEFLVYIQYTVYSIQAYTFPRT